MVRKKPVGKEEMLLRMSGLCSRSEQCESDLRRKMQTAGLPAADIDSIVEYLRANRFLDNSRYARAFANDKVRFSSWGRRKIRMALVAKRIPGADITAALESVDAGDYAEALRRAAEAKGKGMDLADREDVARLYRHLLGRGFESDLIVGCIRRMRSGRE